MPSRQVSAGRAARLAAWLTRAGATVPWATGGGAQLGAAGDAGVERAPLAGARPQRALSPGALSRGLRGVVARARSTLSAATRAGSGAGRRGERGRAEARRVVEVVGGPDAGSLTGGANSAREDAGLHRSSPPRGLEPEAEPGPCRRDPAALAVGGVGEELTEADELEVAHQKGTGPGPEAKVRGVGREAGGDDGGWFAGCRPLLVEMSHDHQLPFVRALEAFRHRVLYGNTCNDLAVGLALHFSTQRVVIRRWVLSTCTVKVNRPDRACSLGRSDTRPP